MGADDRPRGFSRSDWKRILEARRRYEAIQPIAAALNAEAAIDTEARHRAADELDAQGEHEAAALLRR